MRSQSEIDKIISFQKENVDIARRLRYVEKLNYSQIAKRMGVTENAVRLMFVKKRGR